MGGLGINGPHHLSSAVSVKEMVSRAYAEPLQKNSMHTQFPVDGVDGDASSFSVFVVVSIMLLIKSLNTRHVTKSSDD